MACAVSAAWSGTAGFGVSPAAPQGAGPDLPQAESFPAGQDHLRPPNSGDHSLQVLQSWSKKRWSKLKRMSVRWCVSARFVQRPFPKVRKTRLVLLLASGWRGRAGMHWPVGRASTDCGGGRRGQWHSCRAVHQPHGRASLARPPCSRRLSAATCACRCTSLWTRPAGCPPTELARVSLCGSKGTARRSGIGNRRSVKQPVADVLPSGLLL